MSPLKVLAALRRFPRSQAANIGIVLAITAVPMTIGLGVGVDYVRAGAQQEALQAATDAAALASANAANSGASTPDAVSAADKIFALDFQSTSACSGSGAASQNQVQDQAQTQTASTDAPIVNISMSSGTVTSTVSATSAIRTLFGGLIGPQCVTLSATSAAQASTAAALYSEAGAIWGDPQVWGDNGQKSVALDCDGDKTGWYDLLSDTKLEINGSCYPGIILSDVIAPQYMGSLNPNQVFEYYLGDTTFMIGDHVVSFSTTTLPNTAANNPNNVFNGFGSVLSVWNGAVTIDGTVYTPDLNTTTTYLGGAVTGQPLTATSAEVASGNCASGVSTNMICAEMNGDYSLLGLNAPYFYTIKSGAYEVQFYYRFDGGRLNVWATKAGACGAPGGIWGKTLVGVYDSQSSDFLVPTSTSKAAEFSNSACAASTTMTAHLIAPQSAS